MSEILRLVNCMDFWQIVQRHQCVNLDSTPDSRQGRGDQLKGSGNHSLHSCYTPVLATAIPPLMKSIPSTHIMPLCSVCSKNKVGEAQLKMKG